MPAMQKIYMSDIRCVMKKVNDEDDFINTIFSRKALLRVSDLLGKDINEQSNLLPSTESVRIEFVREYYRVDTATRSIIKKVMTEYFQL